MTNPYRIILAHCEKTVRYQRLKFGRAQPELINDTMDSWAEYLKKQAQDKKVDVLNTSFMNMQEMVAEFNKLIHKERF